LWFCEVSQTQARHPLSYGFSADGRLFLERCRCRNHAGTNDACNESRINVDLLAHFVCSPAPQNPAYRNLDHARES
jgi:hypothetical protein